MERVGLGLSAKRVGENTIAVFDGERRLGWCHISADSSAVMGRGLLAEIDDAGLCPGDVGKAIAAHFAPVVHAGDLPEGEPWDAPHRRHEEAMELLKRLERRANR